MRSLEMAGKAAGKEPREGRALSINGGGNEGESAQQFKALEDDHIEQMIEELLDYGSIELSSVGSE